MSRINVDKITGATGTASGAPITLSGDTATLSGTGVTFLLVILLDKVFIQLVRVLYQIMLSVVMIQHHREVKAQKFGHKLIHQLLLQLTSSSEQM